MSRVIHKIHLVYTRVIQILILTNITKICKLYKETFFKMV